ncbi:MAG: hypothetical protein IJJ33_16710 [Victivallales bacterium]|nr:hypothetical protein [Victivallales bacterium]
MTDSMIVEAIRSVRGVSPTSAADTPAGAAAPVASPESVARFQAAMAAPVEETAAVESIPFVDQASRVWHSAQENRQGLLHRIRALSAMNAAPGGPSAASLMELQYEVANLSFQQEVVTKVADKTSNAVQTLIKNQ